MPLDKNFWMTFVVVLVLGMGIGFVNHGVLLAGDYEALTPQVMRPLQDQEAKFGFQILAQVMIAFGFSWIYHAVANFPLELSLKQCVFDGLGVVGTGLAAAFVNR